MSELYYPVLYTHVTCVVLSISLFLFRCVLMLKNSELLQLKVVNRVPHFIDTILLGSALWLTLIIDQYPISNDWLTAKLTAVILYILVGAVALKRGKTKQIRVAALILSLLIILYIVSVAYFHDPMGVLRWFS